MTAIIILLSFVLGYVVHAILMEIFGTFDYDGYFEIDDTDELKTVWKIYYKGNPEEIKKLKKVILKVKTK